MSRSDAPSLVFKRLVAAVVLVALGLAGFGASSAQAQTDEASPAWLDAVNFYRATAGLAPVVNEPTWTDRQVAHARYIVSSMQDCETSVHTEQLTATNGCDANPDATEEGALAGANSDVLRTVDPFGTPTERIHGFMERPYHAQWILDPALEKVAFGFATTGIDGSVQGDRTTYQAAAVLDVLTGRTRTVDPSEYPVVWPGNGTKIPASSFLDENPNPLDNCPRSIAPTGLPIIIRFADAPNLTDDDIVVRADGQSVGHCWFTSAADVHRTHPVGNTLFVIPDNPLEPGTQYTVEIGGPVPVRTTFDVIGEPVATSFQAEATDDGSISVTWSPPFYDGGAPIEEYLIIAIDEEGTGRQVTKPANQSQALIGDLDPGRYLVRVHARNAGNRRPAFSFEQDLILEAAAVTTTTIPTTTTPPTTTAPPATTIAPTTTTAQATTSTTSTTVAPTTAPPSTVAQTVPSSTTMLPTTVATQPQPTNTMAPTSPPAQPTTTPPTVAGAVVVAERNEDLPFTGGDERGPALLGATLALLGLALVIVNRGQRRPTALSTTDRTTP